MLKDKLNSSQCSVLQQVMLREPVNERDIISKLAGAELYRIGLLIKDEEARYKANWEKVKNYA